MRLAAGGNTLEFSAAARNASTPDASAPAEPSHSPGAPEQAAQSSPVSSREADVHAILDALERKEITVDEAEALLDGLR